MAELAGGCVLNRDADGGGGAGVSAGGGKMDPPHQSRSGIFGLCGFCSTSASDSGFWLRGLGASESQPAWSSKLPF